MKNNCIIEKLKKAACERDGVPEIYPAVHDSWPASCGQFRIDKGHLYHTLEYHHFTNEDTSHSIAINAYTGKVFEEEYKEES